MRDSNIGGTGNTLGNFNFFPEAIKELIKESKKRSVNSDFLSRLFI